MENINWSDVIPPILAQLILIGTIVSWVPVILLASFLFFIGFKEIFPDFVYRKRKEDPYYVAQIFLGSDRRRDIRSKIQKYILFFSKGEWAQQELLPKFL